MTCPAAQDDRVARTWIREILARDGWAMLAAACLAVCVQLGVFLAASVRGTQADCAVAGALATAVVWVAIACPILAAGPERAWGGLMRAGTAADASVVLLIVLWATEPQITFPAIVKIYTVLAGVALAGMAAARCARSAAGRYTAGVAAAVVLLAIGSGPFWFGGIRNALDSEQARTALSWTMHANPFCSVTDAVDADTPFVWHKRGWLYWVADSGAYPDPRPTRWYSAAAIYLPIAAVLGIVALACRRRQKSQSSISRSSDANDRTALPR